MAAPKIGGIDEDHASPLIAGGEPLDHSAVEDFPADNFDVPCKPIDDTPVFLDL